MLGKLFGSKARVKILKLFLVHPEKRYYIRQLARDLGLQVNSVRRELDNLKQFGLLKTYDSPDAEDEKESNKEEVDNLMSGKIVISNKKRKVDAVGKNQEKKYYQTDKDFILYEEIKALIIKAQVLYEKDFIEKIKNAGIPKLLILSGFFVNSDSPIDLLIVGRINKNKLIKLIGSLEKELGKELNFTIMSQNEFKYRKDITDVFLYSVLEGKRLVVIDELS
jgi:hypothetical protein